MKYEIKDILTLDDNNEYEVISKAIYENKNYYFLLDINNYSNIKFCYEDEDDLVESEDKELNTKLLLEFAKDMEKIINGLKN